jgi:hypothetical protein
MTTPEGRVKDAIKDYLDSLKPDLWYFAYTPMGYGVRGIPDIIGCYKGRFFAVEVKAPGGKPKPWQDRMMQVEITPAGGVCIVADAVEIVKRVFTLEGLL